MPGEDQRGAGHDPAGERFAQQHHAHAGSSTRGPIIPSWVAIDAPMRSIAIITINTGAKVHSTELSIDSRSPPVPRPFAEKRTQHGELGNAAHRRPPRSRRPVSRKAASRRTSSPLKDQVQRVGHRAGEDERCAKRNTRRGAEVPTLVREHHQHAAVAHRERLSSWRRVAFFAPTGSPAERQDDRRVEVRDQPLESGADVDQTGEVEEAREVVTAEPDSAEGDQPVAPRERRLAATRHTRQAAGTGAARTACRYMSSVAASPPCR